MLRSWARVRIWAGDRSVELCNVSATPRRLCVCSQASGMGTYQYIPCALLICSQLPGVWCLLAITAYSFSRTDLSRLAIAFSSCIL